MCGAQSENSLSAISAGLRTYTYELRNTLHDTLLDNYKVGFCYKVVLSGKVMCAEKVLIIEGRQAPNIYLS
jgi:hypothetical protein